MNMRTAEFLILAAALALASACRDHKEDDHQDGKDKHAKHTNHKNHADEHGDEREDGHDEHGDEHEDGLVQLTPETAARIGIREKPVEERAMSGVLSTTGRVGFDEDHLAHVSPRVSGRVHRVHATLGQDVKSGEKLAVIDSIELGQAKSEYLRARAQLSLAKSTLDRERDLRKDKITSEESLLQAQAAHQRAQADFQSARQKLRLFGLSKRSVSGLGSNESATALFTLTAPIAGTIVEKHVNLGEVVSPDRVLYTVADLSRLWIWIDVYERDLARVHLQDDVTIKVDAFPGRTFEGKVAYIRDQVDPDSRTARARVDVPNPDRELRAGMFADVTVTDPHGQSGGTAPKTIVVPASAVQRDGKGHIAFVSEGDHRYRRRKIQVGRTTEASVEVLGGLKSGERVVVEGTFILKSEAAKESMGGGHSH